MFDKHNWNGVWGQTEVELDMDTNRGFIEWGDKERINLVGRQTEVRRPQTDVE